MGLARDGRPAARGVELFESEFDQFPFADGRPTAKEPVAGEVELLESIDVDKQVNLTPIPPGTIETIWGLNAELLRYYQEHPELIDKVHPGVFEEIVAAIFRNEGFEAEILSS